MNRLLGPTVWLLSLIPSLTQPLLGEWNWKSPRPQGNDLLKVQFIDSLHGWAVGNYGTILRTTTGGTTWYEQEFARTDDILDIAMISATEGWAVGDNGTILHTTDSGDDWLEQSSGIATGLNGVVFLDSLNGWAVGDDQVILHTSNSGGTWVMQHHVPAQGSLNDVFFLTANNGWAVGSNNKLFHSTDGGLSWSQRTIGTGSITFASVTFVGPSLGLLVGTHGEAFRSTDGGLFWPPVSVGDTTDLNQIKMLNSSVGWIVGESGKLYKTLDGGGSWSGTVLGDGSSLNGLALLGNEMWIVGELGHINRSTNNGGTWIPLDFGSRLSVNWTCFPSATIGYTVGQTGLVARTTDTGESWVEALSPSPSISCYGVASTDETHAWAVGDDGTIIRTTDGNNWSTQASGVSHSLFGISFANSSAGWIVGGEFTNFTGVVLQTSDGGNSWSAQYNAVPQILFGTSFPNGSSGWAVGENGYIIHTSDGGVTWAQQASGTSAPLFWCSFNDANTGWAVGDSGIVLHTSDGGASWNRQTSGVAATLYSIAVISPLEVFVSGDLGVIIHTTDGGSTWNTQYSRTLSAIFGIAHGPGLYVIACGDYGTIVKNTVTPPGFLTIGSDVNAGWNVVSLPLNVPDRSKVTLYPTAQGSAFGYVSASYDPADTLTPGHGYWIQFSSAQTVSITGVPIPTDTIYLDAGWNIIGVLSDSVPAGSLITEPPGIITSSIFGYRGSYFTAQTLDPASGYWIKASQPGLLILHLPPAATFLRTGEDPGSALSALNSLNIRDGRGNGTTLYFGRNVDERLLIARELPPLPPRESFDARFGNGNAIASFAAGGSSSSIIRIQAQGAPLALRWHLVSSDHAQYRLEDGETALPLTDWFSRDGELTLKNSTASTLRLSATPAAEFSIPKEFSLRQNYPNPFNPSTAIPFTLPTKSHVRLEILSTLGQQVATLINQDLDEGFHTVTWSSTTASGIYFYRMQATSIGDNRTYSAVRKFIVLR